MTLAETIALSIEIKPNNPPCQDAHSIASDKGAWLYINNIWYPRPIDWTTAGILLNEITSMGYPYDIAGSARSR